MNGLREALLQIWRLTYPYFTTRESTEVAPLPMLRFRMQERWVALGLAALVIGIEFAKVAINVRLTYFNRDWFNAIQNKDAAEFWRQLIFVFCFWAVIYVVVAIYQYAIRSYLRIRWRRWMTAQLTAGWLGDHNHYRMHLAGGTTDNPDQRIQEDVSMFTLTTLSLALGILSSVTTLFSFSFVLWQLSADFTLPGTEVRVPGFLLWGALVYAVVGTWLTHLIGRPLIRLNFEQQRYEADFRFSLARLREYGEQVALLKGEPAEREHLRHRFGAVIGNFLAIVGRTKRLTAFTAGYAQVSAVIPYVLVAPYYFAGRIPLGGMTQTASVFSRVQDAMSFFIEAYQTLADYKAVVDRLTSFDAAIDRARAVEAAARLTVEPVPSREVRVAELSLALPNGRVIAEAHDLVFRPGEAALLVGPSGSGKSTLFRAIAGIWPFGEGRIETPAGASIMLLPQRPYLPIGSLKSSVIYPAPEGAYDDRVTAEALRHARLSQLVERLHQDGHWAQTLSLGEQQRLAIARALLAKPDWLFLDEATAALDEPTEKEVYRVLREHLPATTIVSIGHRSTLGAFHDRRLDMRPDENGVFTPTDLRAPVAAQ